MYNGRKKEVCDRIIKIKARNKALEAALKLTYKNCESNKEMDLIKEIAKK